MSTKPGPTTPCRVCGRKFVTESLPRHEAVCAKQAKKKRKVFNSMKQRLADTGLSVQQAERSLKKPDPQVRPRGGGWRREHNSFIQAIRAAKMMAIAEKTGKPLPASFYQQQQAASAPREDLVLCPHCGRRFNDSSAERHIPFCKQQRERVSGADKQQRVAARTQFKPPPLRAAPAAAPAPAPAAPGGGYSAAYAATRAEAGGPRTSMASRTMTTPQAKPSMSTQNAVRMSNSSSSGLLGSGAGAGAGAGSRMAGTSSYSKAPAAPSAAPPSGYSNSMAQSMQRRGSRGSSNTPNSSYGAPSRNAPPAAAAAAVRTTVTSQPAARKAPQVSGRFCHECGSSFATPQVKFCMDCGAKRLMIA